MHSICGLSGPVWFSWPHIPSHCVLICTIIPHSCSSLCYQCWCRNVHSEWVTERRQHFSLAAPVFYRFCKIHVGRQMRRNASSSLHSSSFDSFCLIQVSSRLVNHLFFHHLYSFIALNYNESCLWEGQVRNLNEQVCSSSVSPLDIERRGMTGILMCHIRFLPNWLCVFLNRPTIPSIVSSISSGWWKSPWVSIKILTNSMFHILRKIWCIHRFIFSLKDYISWLGFGCLVWWIEKNYTCVSGSHYSWELHLQIQTLEYPEWTLVENVVRDDNSIHLHLNSHTFLAYVQYFLYFRKCRTVSV